MKTDKIFGKYMDIHCTWKIYERNGLLKMLLCCFSFFFFGTWNSTFQELVALAADARRRLGDDHWTAAAAALVLHFRCRAPGGL